MSRVAVFDVDGTLMNINHRRKFVEGDKKDWKSFFDFMEFDTINDKVFHMAHALRSDNFQIVIMSGRNERHRKITEKQLAFGKLDYDILIMRPDDNYDPDYVFKQEMLDLLIADDKKPWVVFDDRPSVVKMWRDNNITCFDVGGWNE